LTKYKDVNSIGFIELLLDEPSQAANLVIEVKYFKQGESNPYWGNKLKNVKVTSHQRVFERGKIEAKNTYHLVVSYMG
jgi:hypothetical protein|tara:strand:+ start:418 stop:651 length:234 start_codon:yes stop_codon:yes gene_type:complete